jgi:hypothetical protein
MLALMHDHQEQALAKTVVTCKTGGKLSGVGISFQFKH